MPSDAIRAAVQGAQSAFAARDSPQWPGRTSTPTARKEVPACSCPPRGPRTVHTPHRRWCHVAPNAPLTAPGAGDQGGGGPEGGGGQGHQGWAQGRALDAEAPADQEVREVGAAGGGGDTWQARRCARAAARRCRAAAAESAAESSAGGEEGGPSALGRGGRVGEPVCQMI